MAKPRDSTRDSPVESEEESGEEEESTSEEENEGSESESEPELPRTQNSQVTKKPAPAAGSKKSESQPSKSQSAGSSSDDDESDSETDSDSPIKKPDPNIKPIASKPMDDAQKTSTSKKPRSEANTSGPTSPAKPTAGAGTKRPSAATGAADAESTDANKRSKKKLEAGVESSEEKGVCNDDSKKLFQRLWSEDDEIVILQGMISFREKNEVDPLADLNAFLEFIKKSIHIDVSKEQLQAKIRRLKKKYENNFGKEKRGKEKVSSKPHEQIAYELSKKIWGDSIGLDHTIESPKANGTVAKRSRTKNAVALAPKVDGREEALMDDNSLGGEKSAEGWKGVPIGLGNSGIESWIAKNGMVVIKGEKREEMEEKWKKLNVQEIEIYAKKLELMLEQTKFVLEAMKSSGH